MAAFAIFAHQECCRFVVADDSFRRRIEMNRPAEPRGDVAKWAAVAVRWAISTFAFGTPPDLMQSIQFCWFSATTSAFGIPSSFTSIGSLRSPRISNLPRLLMNILPLVPNVLGAAVDVVRIRRRPQPLLEDQHPPAADFIVARVFERDLLRVGKLLSSSKKYLPPAAETFAGCVSTPRPHSA